MTLIVYSSQASVRCEGSGTRLLHNQPERVGYRITEQAVRAEIGEDLIVTFDLVLADPPVDMSSIQHGGMGESCRGDDFRGGVYGLGMKLHNTLGLVRHDKSPEESWILRRNTGWTLVAVADEGVHATQGEHHAARAVADVCAQSHILDQMESREDLAGCDDLDVLFQAKAGQTVGDKGNRIAQRHANGVGVFQRCCARAAFTAVDSR